MASAKNTVARRGATLVLAAIACLMLLAVLPLLWPQSIGSAVDGGRVEAAPRDTTYIETPVVLSKSPFLRLDRGRLTIATPALPSPANGSQGVGRRLLTLRDAQITLETANPIAIGAREDPPLYGPAFLTSLADQLTSLGFDRLQIERTTIKIMTSGRAEYVLTDLDANIDAAQRNALALTGSFNYRGERISIDGTTTIVPAVSGTRGSGQTVSARPFRVTVASPLLRKITFDGQMDGHADLRVSGRLEADLPDTLSVARWLGVPISGVRVAFNSQVAAEATWASGVLGLRNAELRFDGQPAAQGGLNIGFPKENLHIDGTLAFATLRLDPYLASATTASAAKSGGGPDWRGLSLKWDAFRSIDVDLRLSASDTRYGAHSLGPAATTLVATKGTLHADVSDLSFAGHRFRIRAEADLNAPGSGMALRGRFQTTDIQGLASQFLGDILVSGPANGQVELKGAADTLGRWLDTAGGKIALTGSPGTKTIFDPRGFRRIDQEVRSASGSSGSLKQSQTSVDSFAAKLSISERQTIIDEATFKLGTETLTLRGGLPRGDGEVELRASLPQLSNKTTRAKTTPGTSQGVAASDARSFDIRGPRSALRVMPLLTVAPLE